MKRVLAGLILLGLLALPASVAVWSQTSHSATVSWTYTQGTDVAVGFNVARAIVSGGPYTIINSTLIPIATLDYVDTQVTAGTTYYYVVNAQDANGVVSAYSAQVVGVIPGNPTVPLTVTVKTK